MAHSEDEAIDRAIRHHFRWCERNGFIPDQPSAGESERVGDFVHLVNVNGRLATYKVRPDGSVRRLGA